jgi:hypothetical protein
MLFNIFRMYDLCVHQVFVYCFGVFQLHESDICSVRSSFLFDFRVLFSSGSLFRSYNHKRKGFIFQNLYLLGPQEIDEYELVDPVDILTPLEKSGFWDGVVCNFISPLSLYCNYVLLCMYLINA